MADLMSVVMDLQAQVVQLRDQFEEARSPGVDDPLGEVLLRVPRGAPGDDGGKLIGNTEDSVPVSGQLALRSAEDSNVVIRTAKEPDDESTDGTVEIGVYYI